MNDGYIRLYRKLLSWQWFKDANTLQVFIALLLDANYEESKFKFEIIKRGQCLTSIKRLQELTGLTSRQIRTSLDKLQKSGEIDKQTTNRYSVITIKKYDDYQDIDKQMTNKRQTNDNIKEYKEEKEYKESISKDIPKKVFLKPTLEEITDYCNERNNGVDAERFYNFYESKGWMIGSNKMKNWKAAVRTWEQKDDKVPSWFNKKIEVKEMDDEKRRQFEFITSSN